MRSTNVTARSGDSPGLGLAVIVSQQHDAVEFSLHGELALSNAGQLKHCVTTVIRPRLDRVVIDLGPLTFVDLRGVGALLHISERCAATDTALEFRGVPTRQVCRILALTHADQELGFHCHADGPSVGKFP